MKKISLALFAITVLISPSVSFAEVPGLGLTTGLYRLYNGQTNDHFYTIDYREAGGGGPEYADKNYVTEGVEATVYTTPQRGTVPLYRLFNPKTEHHAYVSSKVEAKTLQKTGFVLKGIDGYLTIKASTINYSEVRALLNPSMPYVYSDQWVKFYRLYNRKTGDRFYTVHKSQVKSAKKQGYREEKSPGYIYGSLKFSIDGSVD